MNYYQIADAAKKVNVESHVLRYWEDELQLPIERNKQGHRLYTDEDLSRFLYIKELKKEGLQLRAIRTKVHMRDEQRGSGSSGQAPSAGTYREAQADRTLPDKGDEKKAGDTETDKWDKKQAMEADTSQKTKEKQLPKCKDSADHSVQAEEEKTRKAARLCMMLQQMVVTAVHEENEGLLREIKKGVAETVSKEMNYQFSIQEQREEEHYKKLDEILRERERRNRMTMTDRKRMKKERQKAEKEKQGAEKESARREKEKMKQEKENARHEKEKIRQMKARSKKEKKQPRRNLFDTSDKNGQEQRA
jgi:DNA-binding transcriptional MerR regulator